MDKDLKLMLSVMFSLLLVTLCIFGLFIGLMLVFSWIF